MKKIVERNYYKFITAVLFEWFNYAYILRDEQKTEYDEIVESITEEPEGILQAMYIEHILEN